jgi:hypothetical protein
MAGGTSRRNFAIAREIYLRGNPGLSRFSRGLCEGGGRKNGEIGHWAFGLAAILD